ncbi:methyl-accepting chemotaxis protein [Mycoplasma leachii]|uniref:methyl-accepting chemotaxis protein n=1 Tax=Mycoplasma leachii TaxID=2105 RepID=UPI003DA20DD1
MINDFQEITLEDLEQNNFKLKENKVKFQFLMRFSLVFSNILTHIFLFLLIIISGLFFGLRYTYYNYKVDLITNVDKIKPSIPKLKEIYKEALEVVDEVKKETDKNSKDSLINKIDEVRGIVKEITSIAREFDEKSKEVKPKVDEVIKDGNQVTKHLDEVTKEIEKLQKNGSGIVGRISRNVPDDLNVLGTIANEFVGDVNSVKDSVEKIAELAKKISEEGKKITSNVEVIKNEVEYFTGKSKEPLKDIDKIKQIYDKKFPIFEKNNKKLQEIWNKLMGIYNQFTVEETKSDYYNYIIYILIFLIIDSLALLVITYMSMISKTIKKVLLFYIFGLLSFNPIVWVSIIISLFSRPIKNKKNKFS